MASGKKRRRSTKKPRVHKSKQKNSFSKKPSKAHTPFNFVSLPNHKELERREHNTWYPKTPRTINNSYTPIPVRVFEVSKGEKWRQARE